MEIGLRDPLLWVDPPAELEHTIVDLIAGTGGIPVTRKRRGFAIGAAAVIVAVTAGAGMLIATRAQSADWELTMPGVAPGIPAATVSGWITPGGTRVVMAAEGLGEAPAGHAYELWFSSGATHISAGTFTSLERPVELTVAVARRDYPRLWLTLEPIDEDPTPSRVVLFDVGG
jgi:hypothetical protein